MDFTIKSYCSLLESLQISGYTFLPFKEYIHTNHSITQSPNQQVIILRHDVDDMKLNSLRFAKIQNELGIKGTYYFRIVPQSYNEQVIKEIAKLGHEIGYHYEDVDLISQKSKVKGQKLSENKLIDSAYQSFCENLDLFRKNFDIKTICMHGSPRSKYDNRDIWKKYDYRNLGIIGEPYFDIDFNNVLYLTDTGRRWDGYKVSIRDKVNCQQKLWENQGLVFHSTQDIIDAANTNILPDNIMMTFHPQRWYSKPIPLIKEFVMQNIKNVFKRMMIISKYN